MDYIEDLRATYIANYYSQKIQQIDNKEEVLDQTKKILAEIINELKEENK